MRRKVVVLCDACGTPFGKFKGDIKRTKYNYCSKTCFGIDRTKKAADNFFSRTKLSGGGCLIWLGAKNSDGYGTVSINYRVILAHRHAYEIRRGGVPPGMHVLHSCDTPACVNPDHLWLGTHVENMRDMAVKGRAYRGGRGNTKS